MALVSIDSYLVSTIFIALPGAERSEALLITVNKAAQGEIASQLRFPVGVYHTNAVIFTPPSPAA